MNLSVIFRVLKINKIISIPLNNGIQVNHYASKGYVKKNPKEEAKLKEIPVEKDVDKLINYCCGLNIYENGEEVKIKPDSEYPDWLWTINTGPPKRLSELDPNTKEYWKLVRKIGIKRVISEKRHARRRYK